MATASPNPNFHKHILRATPLSFTPQVFTTPVPIVSPPLPKTRAPEQEQETQRVCEWCDKSIPQESLSCPNCRKWRKDIEKDRYNAVWMAKMPALSLGLAVLIIFIAWPTGRPGDSWGDRRGHPWHVEVDDSESRTPLTDPLLRLSLGDLNKICPLHRWDFSMGKFLTSWSGWLVMILLASFIWQITLYFRAGCNLKRKTGLSWPL